VTVCIVFGKVRHIGVDRKDHIACKVADACIGMCRDIIKNKLMTCVGHGIHALCLSGHYSADGRKNGWFNCMTVIEKYPDNILRAFDAFFGEWGCEVHCDCLHLCPELDWGSLVWCMLWLEKNLVLVFEECLTDVV
jgi:hypothetical protein